MNSQCIVPTGRLLLTPDRDKFPPLDKCDNGSDNRHAKHSHISKYENAAGLDEAGSEK